MTAPTTVHAAALLVGEHGVLIRGPAGSGKSSLVLALLAANRPAAWLVADDRVDLLAVNGRLLASVPPAIAGLLEIRGQGIVERRHVSPAQIHFVVDLLPEADCPRLPESADERTEIDGIALPRLALPISAHDGALRLAAALERHFG